MLRFFLLTAILCIGVLGQVCSQSCLPYGITFNAQAHLDSFPVYYPNCTEIEGFVHIEGSDIKNLNGLNNIHKIGEYLRLQNNDSLTTLAGLDNLNYLYGSLIIGSEDVPGGGSNPVLSAFTGLENLEFIGEDLYVSNNFALLNFSGLSNLSWIGGRLYCSQNYSLINFSGLDKLDSIGTSLIVGGNASLQDFSGFEGLSRINGTLRLGGCDMGHFVLLGNGIASFEGLHNIEYIGGNLEICRSDRTNISGLDKLSSVGGTLSIHLNDNLVDLSGLDSLKYIGDGIEIGWYYDWYGAPCGNTKLTNIEALMGIVSIGGGPISIERNPALLSLKGLENIDPASIGSIYIWSQHTPLEVGHLTDCAVKSICEYLGLPGATAVIGENAFSPGCNSIDEVEQNCDANGINDPVSELAVDIFPNPASQNLNIKAEGKDIDAVHIYTLTGQCVFMQKQTSSVIDVSGLKAGMYIIEATIDSSKICKKLFIQR